MGSPNPSSPLPLNIFFCSMWNFFPLQTFPHFKPDLPVTAKFSLLLLKAWSVSLKFNSFLFMFSIPEINCFCYLFFFLRVNVEGGRWNIRSVMKSWHIFHKHTALRSFYGRKSLKTFEQKLHSQYLRPERHLCKHAEEKVSWIILVKIVWTIVYYKQLFVVSWL